MASIPCNLSWISCLVNPSFDGGNALNMVSPFSAGLPILIIAYEGVNGMEGPNVITDPLKVVHVDGLLGRRELAKILDVGVNSIDLLMSTGVLPVLRWGKIRKVRVFTLNRVLEEAEEKGINLLDEAQRIRDERNGA